MSREKQIEEMARELNTATFGVNVHTLADHLKPETINKVAEYLYNAGYRKQSEGEWIAKDNFNGRCTIATCSNCGTEKAFSVLVSIDTIVTLYPYCQKCGAKMSRKEDEGK